METVQVIGIFAILFINLAYCGSTSTVSPPVTTPAAQVTTFRCNFDNSLCGFVQDSNDVFDWTRHSGSTSSSSTGPSADHTSGYGYYIYIESSSPRQPGDNAKLISPKLLFNGSACLIFYFHMYGASMGTLMVTINGKTVFSTRGDRGDKWIEALADVSLWGLYAIIFEGVRGSGFTSDLAIDDIRVLPGNCFANNYTQVETNKSCVQAVLPVSAYEKRYSCIFYNYTTKGGFCEGIIKSLYVFGHSGTISYGEFQTETFRSYFKIWDISDACRPIIRDLFCRYHFPPCDVSLDKPRARQICRKSCEYLDQELCKKEMIEIRKAAASAPYFDKDMINCSLFQTADGGKSPECYQYYPLSGDDTISKDCYYGVGGGYRGSVNTTRSGLTCQAWSKQCPHRHWRIPRNVVDGQNDSNMCRNPDSSAPDGPWCYTTDPKVRWEYCNVPRCPPRVPKEAPTFLKGFTLNSTAVHISWNRLPPTRYKEPLLGYQVIYRRVGSGLYKEVNTTSNFTETVLTRLAAQTTYEIKVRGFNVIGHGPSSKTLVIKTLSFGDIIVDFNLQLIIDADFHKDLLNHSSSRFIAMEKSIKTSIMNHFNNSLILKIYDVKTLQFSKGSVQADIKVFATINKNTTKKGDAIDDFIEGLDSFSGEALKLTGFVIQEKPPPPRNLQVVNVQTRYMVFTWDEQKYDSYYQVHNYTIEKKTSTSENFTEVRTLPYDQTGMTIKDLKPSTEYIIRLSSNNRYGRSDGVYVTEGTLPDRFIQNLILIIVLPLTLAVLFVLIACLKFGPTCKKKAENDETELCVRGDWLEIPSSNITLQEKLGEGAFGEVFKGLARIDGKPRDCAVKKLKANATETEKRDLLNELQIMVTVGEHPNVISLIGACTRNDSILVVVRLAENGCLLNQLRKDRENPYYNVTAKKNAQFTQIDKTRIARDVANGMLHLSNKKCVHRDLAARNVLLGKNDVAMVSDFGLSRDVYESGEYETLSGGMLPVRWMALESLEDYTFTTKSDVWSFGILLWEIQTGGKMPYAGIKGMEVVEFIRTGNRLTKPDRCTDEIYEIMMSCWSADPSQRPSFADLVTSLEQELKNGDEKEDYQKDESPEIESLGIINLITEIEENENTAV